MEWVEPGAKEWPMMKCGHAANAINNRTGDPVCVICFSNPDSEIINPDHVIPEGRMARCGYDKPGRGGGGKKRRHEDGDSITASKPSLAFFQEHPDKDWDSYYCGCWGWD